MENMKLLGVGMVTSFMVAMSVIAENVADLPLEPTRGVAGADWLLDASQYKAGVYQGSVSNEIVLANGLLRRVFRLSPNAATVGLENMVTGESVIRGVKPEAVVTLDGTKYNVGGLVGQPNYAFLTQAWIDELRNDPQSFQFVGFDVSEPDERIAWKQARHAAPDVVWPPKGVALRLDFKMPDSAAVSGDTGSLPGSSGGVTVSVHYELYDGIPCYSKWITVKNNSSGSVKLNSFISDIMAAVEYSSVVDGSDDKANIPNVHVETDYAMGGMDCKLANNFGVHWGPDPQYKSQVNYLRMNPCLLEVRPELGPAQELAPGDTFTSFRDFVLPYDSYDRERKGLEQRRMYRLLAPWATENPLMMHVRNADWKTVKNAIDQCADVGFEMVILSFGSGFNIENNSKEYLEKMKKYADYAHSKGVEIGGYSLLASRRVGGGNDVVLPKGMHPRFGHSPCLCSSWGLTYFTKLYQFYPKTGFDMLEHDGSYPGDPCEATNHPGHKGWEDSRWNQRKVIGDFYAWCRANGIYLNVPDYYFMSGSSKCGMGYREVNWSLPRAQQVIHTRQNIFDGTWEKTPTMGWMFVPLTQYHGGGAAATIEPLDQHIDHYRRMIQSNLAMGVQACYRGPRLYDTKRVRDMLKRQVDWFKQYRDILESDMIHGRRADAQDIDWMLHVNPHLKNRGMLVVFNPLQKEVTRTIRVPLYYTGLTDAAQVSREGAPAARYKLARDYSIELPVKVAPEGFAWYVIRK